MNFDPTPLVKEADVVCCCLLFCRCHVGPKLLCFIGELSDTEHVMVMVDGPPDLLDTCHAPGESRSTQSQVKQEPTVHYYSYPSLLTSNSRYQIIYSTSSTMSGFLFSWSSSFIKSSVVQLNTKHKFKQTVCLSTSK